MLFASDEVSSECTRKLRPWASFGRVRDWNVLLVYEIAGTVLTLNADERWVAAANIGKVNQKLWQNFFAHLAKLVIHTQHLLTPTRKMENFFASILLTALVLCVAFSPPLTLLSLDVWFSVFYAALNLSPFLTDLLVHISDEKWTAGELRD